MENTNSVLLIGASTNPERTSNQAISLLKEKGYYVYSVGKNEGIVDGMIINTTLPPIEKFDVITLYLNQKNQRDYYEKLFLYSPDKIIFNPGSENEELKELCEKHNVEAIEGCTLVMLKAGTL